MGGPSTGKYLILRAGMSAPPASPVGACYGGIQEPVIVGGDEKVWEVTDLGDGKYHITLAESHRCTQVENRRVIVTFDRRAPAVWSIQEQQDGTYSIEVPTGRWPTDAWTLNNNLQGSPVMAEIFELPRPGQLWNFRRMYD